MPPQQQHQHQQQPYPFHQAPSPFIQQQQQFQQQATFPQQQENAFAYGNQFAPPQAYPFQQHQHQHQAPPSWGTYYDNYGAGGYGAPAPASVPPPLVPEPTSAPLSTELALPRDSPRGGAAAYPGGFPHPEAAAHGIVTHPGGGEFLRHEAPSYGIVAHPGVHGFPHHEAPSYDLPAAALAPPSTYPPSSESEESESEESDEDLAVARYESPAPVRTVAKAPRRSILRRGPKKTPYPTETRYVPPQPERLSCNYYPKEMRGQGEQQHERAGSGSGLVLKLHLGTRGPDRAAPAPAPTSVGPLMTRSTAGRTASTSSRGQPEGGMGGLVQEMDRMFANVMGGGMFGAGVSLDVAGEEGSGRGLNGSFSNGSSGNSRSGGVGQASMMSSRTVVDGRARTVFARAERTVVSADGTRETNVSPSLCNTQSYWRDVSYIAVCGFCNHQGLEANCVLVRSAFQPCLRPNTRRVCSSSEPRTVRECIGSEFFSHRMTANFCLAKRREAQHL